MINKEQLKVDIYFYQPASVNKMNSFRLSSVLVIEGVRCAFSKVYQSEGIENICYLLDSFLDDALIVFKNKREDLLSKNLSV